MILPPHPFDTLLTEERAAKYRSVLSQRTRRVTVVIEDCHDPHNATAVVRTCDAFGIQDVHVTTGRNAFKVNRRVSQGSHHYIDLHVHPDITTAYAVLREQGRRIFVSDLHADAVVGPQRLGNELHDSPIALVFGSEQSGVSPAAVAAADGCFLIPMVGFPQSLNLSVSVAVTLYALRGDRLAAGKAGDLDLGEQTELYERWVEDRRGEAVVRLMRAGLDIKGEEIDIFTAKEPGK
jgi:tRNA (guanosine-2'-O-)-methyltransferase